MKRAEINTKIVLDYEAMSQYCADLVEQCLKEKPDSLLCFAAGSTGVRTFEILIERRESGRIDFSQAKIVALDEWLGLDEQSEKEDCTHFMKEHLYGPLQLSEEQCCLVDVHAQDYEKECQKIDRCIWENGGIDLVLLGIGMNGHLGLNEPGSPFDMYTRVVELSEVTKTVGQKYFSHAVELTGGITIGIRHLFDAKKVVLQVYGEQKQKIMKQMYEGPVTEELPATVFKLLPGGIVVTDEAAVKEVQYGLKKLEE